MAPQTALHPVDTPPLEAGPPAPTNATRHLSAGAYLDDDFRTRALREVYHRPWRAVAPSHGFDLVTVLGHCMLARRAAVVRDLLLIAVLGVALWHSPTTMVAVLAVLLAGHAGTAAAGVGRDALRYLRGTGFRRLMLQNLVAHLLARTVGVTLAYASLAAGAVVLTIAVRQTDAGAGRRLAVGVPVLLACLVAVVVVPVGARVWNHVRLRALTPARPPARPLRNHRLDAIDRQANGNTVVYSGHSPFVGSGVVLRHRDLTRRLVHAVPKGCAGTITEADREFPTPPFTALDICAHVRDRVSALAADPVPERRLPDLTVHDRVFVAGTEVSRIRCHTGPEDLAEIIRNPGAPERHHLALQVVSSRGDLVTTVYVHCAVRGGALSVEVCVTGLPPCDPRFRVVDEVGGTGPGALLRECFRAAVAAPSVVASAPRNLLRACADTVRLSWAADPETARPRRGYEHGAAVAVRELGVAPMTPDHARDLLRNGRLVERRVLDAVRDFLELHHVDVTGFGLRSPAIPDAVAVTADPETGDGT